MLEVLDLCGIPDRHNSQVTNPGYPGSPLDLVPVTNIRKGNKILALFLKRVIRECLRNNFRCHDLQIIIVMLIYSVTFMYFF